MNETEETPNPSGEPTPVKTAELERENNSSCLSSLGILGAGLFGAFALVSMSMPVCAGAASSARLTWKQRQAAIEEAIRQQQADVQTPAGNERTAAANE